MRKLIGSIIDRIFQRLIVTAIRNLNDQEMHPRKIILKEVQAESAVFAKEHMTGALIRDGQFDILKLAVDRAPEDGMILEFGVAGGTSINYIALLTDRDINGFDSFEGLPEDWAGRPEEKGHYSLQGKMPSVRKNVILHKGWFNETLPAFLEQNSGSLALLHIDCDLYSSTKTVLDALVTRFVPGTVIVFDEFFNIPNWRQNEYRAFMELVKSESIEFNYICWGYQQVCVRIDKI